VLGWKLPQGRDGYAGGRNGTVAREAAE